MAHALLLRTTLKKQCQADIQEQRFVLISLQPLYFAADLVSVDDHRQLKSVSSKGISLTDHYE
jgi:hypothetical protein